MLLLCRASECLCTMTASDFVQVQTCHAQVFTWKCKCALPVCSLDVETKFLVANVGLKVLLVPQMESRVNWEHDNNEMRAMRNTKNPKNFSAQAMHVCFCKTDMDGWRM